MVIIHHRTGGTFAWPTMLVVVAIFLIALTSLKKSSRGTTVSDDWRAVFLTFTLWSLL